MGRISVVVPVYKTEKYLEKCVKSIIDQTYKDLEIILVNDGSPDGSGLLCDEIAKKDDRVKVIHKVNGGLSSARNAGIDAATGEYLGFVDSDDWIEPEMYEVLYKRLTQSGADISCCNIVRRRGDEKIPIIKEISLDATFSGHEAMERVLDDDEKILFSMANKLFRTELFKGLRLREGILFEDYQLMPQLLLRAEKVTCTGMPLYNYYESEGSILRGEYSTRLYDYVKISRENIEFYRENCREGYDRIREIYMTRCLDILLRSSGNHKWDKYRVEIIQDLEKMSATDIYSKLRRNTRIKLRLLFLSPAVYYLVASANRKMKRLLGKKEIVFDTANGF